MFEPQRFLEIRCSKCGKKLGEYLMADGCIQILCMYNAGRGSGACRTMNIVTVRTKINDKLSNHAI